MIRILSARGKDRRLAPALLACLSLVVLQAASTLSAAAEEASCSGFACLFPHDDAPKTPAAPVQPAAADSAARDANAQALKEGLSDTQAQEGASAKPKSAAPRPVVARPVVTIAAEASEVDRLKRLSLAIPREKIKILRPDEAADFTLSRALGDADHGGTRLFTEALHIVAGPDVHTLKDLDGKSVAFAGARDAQAAARQAFESAHVAVKATPLDLANALDGLSTGDLDAVVVLSPVPVAPLAVLKTSGLHLVPWPDGTALPTGATMTAIDADRYPTLVKSGESVRAVTVDAVLELTVKGTKAPAAQVFLTTLSQHAAALAKQGFDVRKAELEPRRDNRVASAAAR